MPNSAVIPTMDDRSTRRRVAIRSGAARLRGLLETEHFFRRAAEPHDPTGLGLSSLLQLREASQGVEIRWPG